MQRCSMGPNSDCLRMMNYAIRNATVNDAEAISTLIGSLHKFFLENSTAEVSPAFLHSLSLSAVRERIASKNHVHLVAESAGEVCGVIVIRDGNHLYHLFVSEKYHGRGIARSLWNRARQMSVEASYTVNSSLFAIPFYERLGFEVNGLVQRKDGVSFQPMLLASRS